MINVRVIYFSIVLVLLIWGCGWLLYEFGGLYPSISVVTWQNVLLVAVGVGLCGVVWLFMKPESHEEFSDVPKSKVKQKKPHKGSLRSLIEKNSEPKQTIGNISRDELEKKLLESKPDSKERRELMKMLREYD